MKVQLAYPYEGKEPDTEIEVEDYLGAQLITQGRARPVATRSKETAADKVKQEVREAAEASAAHATVTIDTSVADATSGSGDTSGPATRRRSAKTSA